KSEKPSKMNSNNSSMAASAASGGSQASGCTLKDKRAQMADKVPVDANGNKLKPCCACPDTRKLRDQCIMAKGEDQCTDLIEAHKLCLRNLGFNI
ncbi:hypothetical protein BOX15_Mlig029109g3, partial [Macrostomum lignano]